MVRIRTLARVVALFTLLAASSSSAARFAIVETRTSSGAPIDALQMGDTVTIGLRVERSGRPFGLQARVSGYDPSVADFVKGRAVASVGGIQNGRGGRLSESEEGEGVRIFASRKLMRRWSESCDRGLKGSCGDAQFRVTFVATGLGSTRIELGRGFEAAPGEPVRRTIFPTVTLVVVPEPSTALLILGGLTVLASRRRGVGQPLL